MTANPPHGEALRALRQAAGMTLQQVSDTAGVSLSYLSRAETNEVNPTAGWWQLVAIAIGEHLSASKATAEHKAAS